MLKSVRRTGVWPNAIIKYIQGIALATVTDPGCPKPPLATDNLSCLNKLECPLGCEILSQPIELPCSVLACAECIIAWLKISGTVLCPCCYSDIPMAPASLRPASDIIISLLHDILVHCTSCGRDMRAGAYVGHQCTRSSKCTSWKTMHLLEDHALQWANRMHVGFGLLGEQGAESIHAKFNTLLSQYNTMHDKVKKLLCIVKQHFLTLSTAPHITPPKKRKQ